jgi:hypothetical protein
MLLIIFYLRGYKIFIPFTIQIFYYLVQVKLLIVMEAFTRNDKRAGATRVGQSSKKLGAAAPSLDDEFFSEFLL